MTAKFHSGNAVFEQETTTNLRSGATSDCEMHWLCINSKTHPDALVARVRECVAAYNAELIAKGLGQEASRAMTAREIVEELRALPRYDADEIRMGPLPDGDVVRHSDIEAIILRCTA